MYNKILVTGGTGMVGKSLQKIIDNTQKYIFIGSKDLDLTNLSDTQQFFDKIRPDAVIHLAAVVGGLFYNIKNNVKLLDINTRINLNITRVCVEYNVKKVILVNSTCSFPEISKSYPMTEKDIHNGPVHNTNEGYGMSKRILEVVGRLYNQSSDTKFINVYPCNLYGPGDNFDINSSHVLSSLIHKIHEAKYKKHDLTLWGTGNSLRQFLYVDDFSRLLIMVLNLDYFYDENIIMCNTDDELSINDLANRIKNIIGFEGNIVHDITKNDGIYRKTVSNHLLKNIFPDFMFTPLNIGIEKTYDYFIKEISNKIN